MEEFKVKSTKSSENKGEVVFNEYVKNLHLSPDDLRKKILDVGSGSAGFATYVKNNYDNLQVFSLDPSHYKKPKKGTIDVRGIAEALPFKNESFELVLSNCSIPNILRSMYGNEQGAEVRIRDALFEMLRVIKPGGEVRLGSVIRNVYPKHNEEPDDQEFVEILDQVFDELKKEYQVVIEEIHEENSYYWDENQKRPTNKIRAGLYLIKIKKPND